jgi:hypothetical protein
MQNLVELMAHALVELRDDPLTTDWWTRAPACSGRTSSRMKAWSPRFATLYESSVGFTFVVETISSRSDPPSTVSPRPPVLLPVRPLRFLLRHFEASGVVPRGFSPQARPPSAGVTGFLPSPAPS